MTVGFIFPAPNYIACSECGATLPRWEVDGHVCDQRRWLEYQIVRLRPDIARFDRDLREWLATKPGRFAVFYAQRERALRVAQQQRDAA